MEQQVVTMVYCVLLFQCLFLTCVLANRQPSSGTTDAAESGDAKAFHSIMDRYEKNVKPSTEEGPIQVALGLSIMCASASMTYRRTALLDTHLWIHLTWTDKRLAWDPSETDGVESISIPSSNLWIPDIRPYNTREMRMEETRAVVNRNGGVTLVTPGVIVTSVHVPSGSFNSTVIAKYKFGSWTYNGNQVNLTSDGTDLSMYTNNDNCYGVTSEDTRRNVVKYDCCPEPYIDISVTLHLFDRFP